jgi:hypothetical protein
MAAAYYSINGSSWYGTINDNTMRSDPCQPGPVRVVLGRAGKEVVDVNVFVGPVQSSPGTTDLGAVAGREAADYLLSLAARTDGRPGRDAIRTRDAGGQCCRDAAVTGHRARSIPLP